jgi:hypothetical protein
MSSVSLIGNSFQACSSPRELLQKELASEVAAGTISSTDQTALSSALDDIDSSLKGERSSGAGQSRPPSPDEMKSKIDDLIAGEVSDGKLTSDQAEELKNVFAKAFSGHHGRHEAHGMGGPGGAGGAPPPPPADSQDDTTSSLLSTDQTSTDSTVQELLAQFLKSLQETLSQSSAYGSNGQNQSFAAALMVDYQA